jgi:septal ring factor EnvC (AmiA/AmiB activator)
VVKGANVRSQPLLQRASAVPAVRSREAGSSGWPGLILCLVAALALAVLPGLSPPVMAQDSAEIELEAVRAEIAALEARIADQTSRRDDGLAELRRLELQIAAGREALAEIDGRARAVQRRQAELRDAESAAGRRLDAERAALAEQVRMSHMTGREEVFKLLLNQESPTDLGRMLTYYDYLNRARGARIGAVAGELDALVDLAAETRTVQSELDRLRSAREAELASLDATRRERSEFIAGLESSIADSGARIERLRDEERQLDELVSELGELLAGFPVDGEAPFADWRGRLSWPVEGQIEADFGQLREGGPLRWNGVMIGAEAGTFVRAIYHGRVAFSDWLPGLGLLVILDHGDGYMSLYGHNEALLRERGDWVRPGEAVAQVGDTGGRGEASLYFEVRFRGEPQDPHDWIR